MPRIGVTGHRFLAEVDKLAEGIDAAIARVRGLFPGEPLTVVSPLAEGADRLVADRVLAVKGSRLMAPLPFAKTEYLRDFESPESKAEFERLLGRTDEVVELPAREGRNSAYEAVGLYVLDHCDVLIAVWDGKIEQGQGGTAGIVAGARERALPIAWVHAGNRRPATNEPTSLGDEQGMVTFENF
jgi:hypothetical protein